MSRRPHRDRTTRQKDAEDYVRTYKCERWIRQCVRCQARGYDPMMSPYGKYSWVLRHYFPPLELGEAGLCKVCERFGPPADGG